MEGNQKGYRRKTLEDEQEIDVSESSDGTLEALIILILHIPGIVCSL